MIPIKGDPAIASVVGKMAREFMNGTTAYPGNNAVQLDPGRAEITQQPVNLGYGSGADALLNNGNSITNNISNIQQDIEVINEQLGDGISGSLTVVTSVTESASQIEFARSTITYANGLITGVSPALAQTIDTTDECA